MDSPIGKADSADSERMAAAAIDAYGSLDILVNSAGIAARSALPEGASPERI